MIQIQELNGTLQFDFSGRLDTAACAAMNTEVTARCQQSTLPVVFNLKSVDFVASSFLRICMLVSQRAGPGRFLIINLEPGVKRVFKIAGLDALAKT